MKTKLHNLSLQFALICELIVLTIIILTMKNVENRPHQLISDLCIVTTLWLFIAIKIAKKNKRWVYLVIPLAIVFASVGLFFTVTKQWYLAAQTWGIATILLAGAHGWGTTGLASQDDEEG